MERVLITLVGIVVALWVLGWILSHFGLILIAAAGFGLWSWLQARQRA
jgi:hypothetical protein